jgi:1-acyl-sn-glycerol-3-phosphate acyltransferase
MLERLSTVIPNPDEQYTHQVKPLDLTDDEFAVAFSPIRFKWWHRLYQIFCFILFLGPFRLLIFGLLGGLCMFLVVLIRTIVRYLGFRPDSVKFLCADIARIGFRLLFFGLGNIFVRLQGKLDPDARFIISNHFTVLDPFAILLVQNFTPTIKKQWLWSSFIKIFLDNANPIYVDHEDASAKEIADQADDSSQFPVLLFPEGARTNGDLLLKFHRSAFITPYRVQPLLIRYRLFFVPNGWNTVTSVQQSFWSALWQVMCIPFFVIEIDALHSISMEVEGKADIGTFMKNAQVLLANHLKIKAVSHSSEDVKALYKRKNA